MATCTELYIDTLGGLDLDGSTDKNLPYFVMENLASLIRPVKNLWGVVEVGALLVWLGWRPPGLSVPLPPLSSPAPQNPEDFHDGVCEWVSVSSGTGLPG